MWVHVCFYTHFLSTLYLCQKKIKVLQTQYLSKFAALSTHTFCPITPNKKAVARAFKRLMPQQQKLLYAYYIENIPLAQLAKQHGISRQAMQQHKHRALSALTVFFNDELNQ